MSNSAPSHHSRPPEPGTSWPRSSTQRTSPSARTIRYSSTNGSPSSRASFERLLSIFGRSSGWTMLQSVRFLLAMKFAAG